VLLFLAIPFAVYLLDLSIESQQSFEQVRQILNQPVFIIVQLILLWSISHHFFAGIRFLLIDAEIGVEKSVARLGSWMVFLAEAIIMLVIIFAVLL
jgi:succinate dehydrogenase / fumarate reductase cytochrome b subunit